VFMKIDGVATEEDALLAVAMGADAVGFIFAQSPRQMAAQHVRDTA
jgi:phosphoribosylanthranilate isomerase